MQYRTTSPEENGFDNEHDESVAMRAFIQQLMRNSGPDDLLDSVLVVVNICENRALLELNNKPVADWYTKTALFFRSALDALATDADGVCPQQKLEDPLLYFPAVTTAH